MSDDIETLDGYDDWLNDFNAAGEADMLDEMAYRHDLENGYLDDKNDNPERELY